MVLWNRPLAGAVLEPLSSVQDRSQTPFLLTCPANAHERKEQINTANKQKKINNEEENVVRFRSLRTLFEKWVLMKSVELYFRESLWSFSTPS